MADANRGEAARCLDIARAALTTRDFDKALRFVDKSMRLFPCDEARKVSMAVKRQQSSRESSHTGASTNHSRAAPNGGGESSAHRRQSTAASRQTNANTQPSKPDNSTPEQKILVRRIRATKDYYEMLGVQKTASEDDLKRSYKKLALKLHPDKNQAAGSEHAFKAVSQAYACLSDPSKKAAYDQYGTEDRHQVGARGGGNSGFGGEGIDPNELFNMFFGGGGGGAFGGTQGNPFGGRTRVYSTNFGGGGQPFAAHAQRRQGEAAAPTSSIGTLLQLIPILLLLLFTFFQSQSSPDASLAQQGEYRHPFSTVRHGVPYWVKNSGGHISKYPDGSSARSRLEDSIDLQYKEQLEQFCQREKVAQMQTARWSRKRAAAMKLPHCDEIYERFGYRYNGYAY